MKVFTELNVGKLLDDLVDRLDFIVSPLGDLIDKVKEAVARLKFSFSQMNRKEPVVSFTELSNDDIGDLFGNDERAKIERVLEETDVFVFNGNGEPVAWYDQ